MSLAPTGLPVPMQVLRGECVTAPTGVEPQGQLRGARGLAGHKV